MLDLRIIIRNLFRRKLSSVFTLISFTIAFCCSILVYLFVVDEFAFDKHNTNFHQIYRLNSQSEDRSISSCIFPCIYKESLAMVSGIKNHARLETYPGKRSIIVDNKPFIETSFLFGDQEILEIFDFEFLVGNPKDALLKPYNIIITKSTAEKYFDNALGKIIRFEDHDFTITGIVKELPPQSHFSMNFLASISSYKEINNYQLTSWNVSSMDYYFLISDNTNKTEIENQLADAYAKGMGFSDDRIVNMHLEPLGDIHLKSVNTRWDNVIKGDIQVVYGLIVIALLILGIAIANYINLLTAEYRRKIKAAGIQRIIGASKMGIAVEQVIETLTLLSLAIVFATIFAVVLLPVINDLSDKSLIINFSVIKLNLLLLLSTISLSAFYPVLFFNSFNPSDAIKDQLNLLNVKRRMKQGFVRGSLATFQLTIATLLIIFTIVISKQLQLVLKTRTGFKKENVLIVKNPYDENQNNRYDLLKTELLKLPMIKSVGVAQNVPGGYINNYTSARLVAQKEDEEVHMGQISIDHDLLTTLEAKFIKGRNFDLNIASDKKSGVIINQSAVESLNLTDPIGIELFGINNAFTPNNKLEIVGVIEDMQYFTLRESPRPVMYYMRDFGKFNITIRLGKGDYFPLLKQIEKLWGEIAPQTPFSYQFMDDRISANYKSEINTAKVVSSLSGIAIFLSVLGILGMIVFNIQRRTKEIGIRKVNGAKVSEILTMLNKAFIKWVAIAFVVACPIAYYTMNRWLENFAYKTALSWWIFALAGALALGIALITVSWQSWRAATKNPVEALRYE